MNSQPSQKPIEICYSYSHLDENLRDELQKHLTLLKRQGVITNWHDRNIDAGKDWEREISGHLSSASIILLLISSDFLASDYCYSIEMNRALERHSLGEARVVPIILRPVDWENAPFAKLLALPRDAKPITTWNNRDEAFLDVAKGIRRVCEEMQQDHLRSLKLDTLTTSENSPSVPTSTTVAEVTEKIDGNNIKEISLKLSTEYDLSNQGRRIHINVLKFTSDGRYLVAGLNQDQVAIWDANSGQLKHIETPTPAEQYLNTYWYTRSIAISHDNQFLASTTYGKAIQIWKIPGL